MTAANPLFQQRLEVKSTTNMFNTRYRQSRGRQTTCAATGTVCRNTTTTLRIGDQTFPSLYCQFHACRQIEAGRACKIAKLPGAVVCSQHIRCQAVETGTRCSLDVKDGNTAKHKYCIELHLCWFPECENQRSQRNEQRIPFCIDHRCKHDNCRNPKDIGVFCKPHTCDDQYCMAFAPGIDMDDPQRFCERHRQCQRPQCPRLCHTRDNGQLSAFCGAHYCQAPDCEDGREAGLFCPAHTCAEPGCLKGRESFKTEYCKSHKCRTKQCRLRRLDHEYCPYHECVYDGCRAEAMEGRLCKHHRGHMESRFGRRLSAQEVGYTLYEDANLLDPCPGINDRKGCGRTAEYGNWFCHRHMCQIHNCQASRTRSSDFCIDHGCPAAGCNQPRLTRSQVVSRGNAEGPFCEEHACRHVGCQNQNAKDSNRCLQHGGRVPRFRRRVVCPEDERPTRVRQEDVMTPNSYRNDGRDGYRDDQRQLGWAEARHRDPWAAWGMMM